MEHVPDQQPPSSIPAQSPPPPHPADTHRSPRGGHALQISTRKPSEGDIAGNLSTEPDLQPFTNKASGHHDIFILGDRLFKETTYGEIGFYQFLSKSKIETPLLPYIPKFFGVFCGESRETAKIATPTACARVSSPEEAKRVWQRGNTRAPASSVKHFVAIENLTYGMKLPCVLDVKMGRRGYGLDATETKKRSKIAKELMSTSHTLGFRIGGLRQWDVSADSWKCMGRHEARALSVNGVRDVLADFGAILGTTALLERFRELIAGLRDVFEVQNDFRLYTSSLLLIYDAARPVETARISMVDFAYTYLVEEVHAAPDGDSDVRDEGYYFGLTTLVEMLTGVIRSAPTDDDSPLEQAAE
jgi:hypothetical protein